MHSIRQSQFRTTVICIAMFLRCASASAQMEIDRQPINYSTCQPQDAIADLSAAVESGQTKLDWDDSFGWLPAILEQLAVPRSSQTLVFSNTSMQFRKISPTKPRAIYFNDDVYIGWVQNGDLELSAVDPNQGAMFYTLKQQEGSPKIVRDRGQCLACHVTSRTQKVPGYLVRSVFAKSDGQPEYRLGTTTTDHTTSFKKRFGGWYVTGRHGHMRHRGNVFVDANEEHSFDYETGANQDSLPKSIRDGSYLQPTSDIVALMVLEHQTQMHNHITRASYATRQAIHQQATMNEALNRPADFRSDSAIRRIDKAAEELLQFMLFCDEFALTSPVKGNSSFADAFSATGIRDSRGRSLRDFDCQQRMFRYPCSFLIYSESYRALPEEVLSVLDRRLREVLDGDDDSPTFAHLSSQDRQNIRQILAETHPRYRRLFAAAQGN